VTGTPGPPTLEARDAAEWDRLARAGRLADAWRVSDRIRSRHGSLRDGSVPRHYQQVWDGSPFAGRRVLVRCYHGLGDTLQFIRYATPLRHLASHVTVWVQEWLAPMVGTVPGVDAVVPLHDGAPAVAYDVDVEVMELPYAFRTTLETIPAAVPYLTIAPARLIGQRPRIGIVWRAGEWDGRRSVPFARLRPLFDRVEATWYALQADVVSDEQHPRLAAVDTRGVLPLARAIRALDLVMTIDSMPAHLAGAMGVPVWTMLPRRADWRWMEHRTDSPWYPTMQLFRQDIDGDWTAVIERLVSSALPVVRQSR